MKLSTARCAFSVCIAELVLHAVSLGFDVALDEGTVHITPKNPTGNHMRLSVHYDGLAQDVLLYRKGVYLTSSTDYAVLGSFWKELGVKKGIPLTWGGDFKASDGKPKPDGNHFSYEWEGRK